MRTISKKQFEAAVKVVLNGGKSNLISTYEVKPFSWSISKKFKTLRGTQPKNSKFLRNDARGGKENDVYLVCDLAAGYEIVKTKKESSLESKKEAAKKIELKNKRDAKANELKAIATANGFSSVAKLKAAQKEIDNFNNARFERAIAKRLEIYESEFGEYSKFSLQNRVRISRIELVFDCEKKQNLI